MIAKIENVTAPLWQWCVGFLGILFVRFFLENLSGPTPSFPAVPDTATLVHYFLFFIGAFLSLALIIRIFVPDIVRVSKFLFFGFPIIWLSPIIDLIRSHGGGYSMAYVFAGNAGDLLRTLLHAGSSSQFGGITGGLGTELAAIVVGSMLYVAVKTRNPAKVALAAIASYLTMFLWMVMPGIVALMGHGGGLIQTMVVPYLLSSFGASHIATNFIRPTVGLSYGYAAETVFNVGMSSVFYLLDLLLIALWATLRSPKMVKALLKNMRPGRIAYYVGMIAMGMLGAIRTQPIQAFANWEDAVLFACLIATYFSAFLFAIGVNDLADINIDRVTGKDRPLPSGTVSDSDFKGTALFFFVWLCLGGFIVGYWALFTVLVFTAAYYIYSAPPLRLKRIPMLSSFLISLATLATLMAGFYFVDTNKLVSDLPTPIIALIVICVTLGVNFKDIKDAAGDRADGVWTVPAIFGEEKGKQITGAMLAAAFLAVPLVLKSQILFAPSLMAGVLGYSLTNMKNYREWPVFLLYFAYAGVAGAILWTHPFVQ